MDINSTNGINAYANVPNTASRIDSSKLREDNVEATGSELETQNNTPQAFEVNITQEAQDRMAEDRTQEPEQVQAAAQQQNTEGNTAAPQQGNNPSVDIMA